MLNEINVALSKLVTSVDAAILSDAESVKSNQEQNAAFESVQSLRIAKHELIAIFGQYYKAILYKSDVDLEVDVEHVDSLKRLFTVAGDKWKADAGLMSSILDLQSRLESVKSPISNPLEPEKFLDSFISSFVASEY